MATLTVRDLDPEIVEALKALGASNGRSMESEVRQILAGAVRAGVPREPGGLGSRIRSRFEDLDVDDGPDFTAGLRSAEPPRAAELDE